MCVCASVCVVFFVLGCYLILRLLWFDVVCFGVVCCMVVCLCVRAGCGVGLVFVLFKLRLVIQLQLVVFSFGRILVSILCINRKGIPMN